MSGWIKVDKDLPESIRFRRMVRAYQTASHGAEDVTRYSCDAALLLGAVLRLWIFADSHIADDNTLDSTFAEIDDIVGVKGFAAVCPLEWLHDLGNGRVELPEFLERNGTSAKQRKDAARRQANFRLRRRNGTVTRDSNGSNASHAARPDQTRPEEIRKNARELSARTPRNVPHGTSPMPRAAGTLTEELEAFIQATYPECSGRREWLTAFHHVGILLSTGRATEADIRRRVAGYRAFVEAGGASSAAYVYTPQNFFDPRAEDPLWSRDWSTPKSREQQQREEREQANWNRIHAYREAIQCPLQPRDHEPAEAFETRVKGWERDQDWNKRSGAGNASGGGPKSAASVLQAIAPVAGS